MLIYEMGESTRVCIFTFVYHTSNAIFISLFFIQHKVPSVTFHTCVCDQFHVHKVADVHGYSNWFICSLLSYMHLPSIHLATAVSLKVKS